jgi:phosphoglycolate phosphatase
MKFKCVIFDLDGTLADTIADIAAAMNRALAARGRRELPAEDYREKAGWGMKRLAFLALPRDLREGAGAEELAEELAPAAARFYAEEPLAHTRAYPGMAELLAELKRRKFKLAVLTNKPDPLARQVVEGLFPGVFDAIRGAAPGIPAKPDPGPAWDLLYGLGCSPRQTLLVGDSEIDAETARAAECPAMGVSWGFRSRQVLEEAGMGRIARSPRDILDLVTGTRI